MAGYDAAEIAVFIQDEMELIAALDGAADAFGEPDGDSQYNQGPMQVIVGGDGAAGAIGDPHGDYQYPSSIDLDICTEVNELDIFDQVSIYPNPAKNNLNINTINSNSGLTVYDITGKLFYLKN